MEKRKLVRQLITSSSIVSMSRWLCCPPSSSLRTFIDSSMSWLFFSSYYISCILRFINEIFLFIKKKGFLWEITNYKLNASFRIKKIRPFLHLSMWVKDTNHWTPLVLKVGRYPPLLINACMCKVCKHVRP